MADQDLIERVARCLFWMDSGQRYAESRDYPWAEADALLREKYEKEARAAIAEVLDAMREPSEAVAGEGADHLFAASSDNWSDDARRVWQAMLDQFRKEVFPDG